MSNIVTLQSNDGQEFKVSLEVVNMSETIKDVIEDAGTENSIPINSASEPWDIKFCDVDMPDLFELIAAANYLHIKHLMDIACKTVANKLTGKSTEEMREILGIENDFTPEEEAEMLKENAWIFNTK